MTTLREWFEDFTVKTGEKPLMIVLGGKRPWNGRFEVGDRSEKICVYPDMVEDLLDVEFSSSYGGNESPNFCAWSEHWVLFPDDYDGAENLCRVPRYPQVHDPIRPGGGSG